MLPKFDGAFFLIFARKGPVNALRKNEYSKRKKENIAPERISGIHF
jgi:hypothetical protein